MSALRRRVLGAADELVVFAAVATKEALALVIDRLLKFETDALTAYWRLALALVLQRTTEEVAAVLKFCQAGGFVAKDVQQARSRNDGWKGVSSISKRCASCYSTKRNSFAVISCAFRKSYTGRRLVACFRRSSGSRVARLLERVCIRPRLRC